MSARELAELAWRASDRRLDPFGEAAGAFEAELRELPPAADRLVGEVCGLLVAAVHRWALASGQTVDEYALRDCLGQHSE